MKLLGFFLLIAGWALVISAVVLFGQATPRAVFVLSGLGVEIVGLVLIARSHPLLPGDE